MYHVCVTLVDSLRVIEIEKCKKDIADIRQQMYTAQKKSLDYAILRWRRLRAHFSLFFSYCNYASLLLLLLFSLLPVLLLQF